MALMVDVICHTVGRAWSSNRRGTRTLDMYDLKKVTPSAKTAKPHYVIVDAIGVTRARTLARSEMTAAYAEAQLNTYEELGIEGVEVEAEFATAGDDVVCPECEELEGKIYSIEESRGVIPVHPNCRCAWIPVVAEARTPEEVA